MSKHDLLTPDQREALRDSLEPLIKDHAGALMTDGRAYLAADASPVELKRLDEARAALLAAEARAAVATRDESEAAELSVGDAEATLAAVLDQVRLSREWAQIHARGELFAHLRRGIKDVAPVLLDKGAKIVLARLGA